MEGQEAPQLTTFEKAIVAIETATCGPDPNAPSCNQYHLRPSEEAALLLNRLQNPPPPWGIKINLSGSFLGPEKCLVIGRKLITSKTVTYLDLSMCDMQEDAAVTFFDYVSRNTTLKHLSVNGNYIRDRGAIAAGPCLAKLESFHCASNGITDVGATGLANAVRTSTTLKTLSVRNNRITRKGVNAIIEALIEPPPSPEPAAVETTQAELSAAETAEEPEVNPEAVKEPEVDPEAVKQPEESRNTNEDAGPESDEPTRHVLVFIESDVASRKISASVADHGEDGEKEEELPLCNTVLHTCWIDQNVDIPEETFTRLALILAQRFPKPPVTKKKKGKKGKKSAAKK